VRRRGCRHCPTRAKTGLGRTRARARAAGRGDSRPPGETCLTSAATGSHRRAGSPRR
jgi:hypothetical protein